MAGSAAPTDIMWQSASTDAPAVAHAACCGHRYGSEFSWDSTGQEEAYVWGRYFNQSKLADTVLDAILAYDPSVPSWAYNGAALSYGDVGNNAFDPWNSTTHTVSYPLGSGSERVS